MFFPGLVLFPGVFPGFIPGVFLWGFSLGFFTSVFNFSGVFPKCYTGGFNWCFSSCFSTSVFHWYFSLEPLKVCLTRSTLQAPHGYQYRSGQQTIRNMFISWHINLQARPQNYHKWRILMVPHNNFSGEREGRGGKELVPMYPIGLPQMGSDVPPD